MNHWYYKYASRKDWLEQGPSNTPLNLHDRRLGPVKEGTPKEVAGLLVRSGFSTKNTLRIVGGYMGNNRRENLVPDPPLEKEEVIEMDKSDVEGDNWEMPSDSDKLYDTPLAMAAEAAAEPEAPPEPEPPPEDPKIATMRKVIEAYIATRDKLKEMKTAYETSIAELKQYQENRELWLQQQLTEMGVQSARTDAGTSYKSIVKSATVADQEEFINWILEAPAERISCMDVKASKSTISEMVEDGKLVPPGINWKTFEKVMVRR